MFQSQAFSFTLKLLLEAGRDTQKANKYKSLSPEQCLHVTQCNEPLLWKKNIFWKNV